MGEGRAAGNKTRFMGLEIYSLLFLFFKEVVPQILPLRSEDCWDVFCVCILFHEKFLKMMQTLTIKHPHRWFSSMIFKHFHFLFLTVEKKQ